MTANTAQKHGVVGDLTPEDDLMHPVSDDSSHNESMFFNFFDTKNQTGGFVRIGNRPNEGHAEMTFCIFLADGTMIFQWGRPEITGNDAFDAAGLSFKVIEPGEHIHIRFLGDAVHLENPLDMVDPGAAMRNSPRFQVLLELDCRAAGPMIGSASGDTGAVIFLDGVGHYQQACSYSGMLIFGNKAIALRARGVRDHSWGKRVWHDIHMDRSFWACAGPNLAFIACKTWHGDGVDPDVIGCVIENGEVHRLKSVELKTRYAPGSARHNGFDLKLTDERGREWSLAGEALSYIPLRHRKADRPILHLGQAMSRFRLNGGPDFLGLSEYFDAQSAVDRIISSPEAAAGLPE